MSKSLFEGHPTIIHQMCQLYHKLSKDKLSQKFLGDHLSKFVRIILKVFYGNLISLR
jgi:hypothetical protein